MPLPLPLPQPPFLVDVEKGRATVAETHCGVEAKMFMSGQRSGALGLSQVPIELKVELWEQEDEEEKDE